ncbi:hypothetical protein [Paraburkholderia sp. GAS348]|uniref:hypothetical protein n=1 Tax=Paraburkholderia sp. GAS348 TaxID=3035132 RepID=UPI003D21747D
MHDLVTLSSYKLYLLVQTLIVRLATGNSVTYSMIVGSLVSRVIYLGAFFALFAQARRCEPIGATWIFALLAGMVMISAQFSAYFNTFFEDQLVIILLPLVALLLYRYTQHPSFCLVVAALSITTFLGAAKPAFFLLPVLIAPLVLPWRGRALVRSASLLFVCAAVALLPVVFGSYERENQYHAVYVGALAVLTPEETAKIDHIGEKPVQRDCIGIVAFAPAGPSCMDRAKATYPDVLRLIGMKPAIAWRLATSVFSEGHEIRIVYLGTGMTNAPDFSSLPVLNVWRALYTHHANVWILASLVAALAAVWRYRRQDSGGAARTFEGVRIFVDVRFHGLRAVSWRRPR